MDKIMALADKHGLLVVEDAAQAIDSYYINSAKEKVPLGSIGHLAAFSFHETKNIISGEGGMLVVNDPTLQGRAEIIWEKGTNRAAFFRGEVNKYGWVDIGSSFLPSEVTAAFLYAQLEHIDDIQRRRTQIWNMYQELFDALKLGSKRCPKLFPYSTNNGHLYYILCDGLEERSRLVDTLKSQFSINAVFHYLSLHSSPFYSEKHDGRNLPSTDRFSNCLLRLPLHLHLTDSDIEFICEKVSDSI